MNLNDVHPEIFGVFVNWLYTQKIENAVDKSLLTLKDLAVLWNLADRFLIPILQNNAMARMMMADKQWFWRQYKGSCWGAVAELVDYVYKEHPSKSPARKLCVALMLKEVTRSSTHQGLLKERIRALIEDDFAYEFTMELMDISWEVRDKARKKIKYSEEEFMVKEDNMMAEDFSNGLA